MLNTLIIFKAEVKLTLIEPVAFLYFYLPYVGYKKPKWWFGLFIEFTSVNVEIHLEGSELLWSAAFFFLLHFAF